MQVYLNDKLIEIKTPSLQALLIQESLLSKEGIALAVNDHVIPKKDWHLFQLQEKDFILIIALTQGG